MTRRLVPIVVALVVAAGCSGDAEDDPSATYFQDAAVISTIYETSALAHFTEYRTALEAATAQTGDRIFVEANQNLFANLSDAFGTAVAGLADLTPPSEAASQHDAWVSAARTLNDVFRSANDQLATLTEAPAANSVVSGLPLADLQSAYRTACESVAALANEEPVAVIACEPPSNGA
jgi:hypothetical protein